jgi:hypothetical protein
MGLRAGVLVATLLSGVGVLTLSVDAGAAEQDWPAPEHIEGEEQRVVFVLSSRSGLVEAPFVTAAFPKVSGFGMVLTGTAAAHLSSVGWLHLKVPVSVVRLDLPAGAQVGRVTPGNLELGLEHELQTQSSTHVALLAALLVPTAAHGPQTALLNNRALALGAALNGGKDSSLLTPGVGGVQLGARFEQRYGAFAFRASLQLPLLARISNASLPAETDPHPLGLAPVLDLKVGSWISHWFGASLGGALIAELIRVQEPILERDRNRRLQAALEPALHARIGRHVALGLDGSIPVGGNLGARAWSVGLLCRIGL